MERKYAVTAGIMTFMVAVGIMTLVMTVMTGCSSGRETGQQNRSGEAEGYFDREENKRLSNAAVETMCHIFMQIAATGGAVILEANFHEAELEKLHTIAHAKEYDVLTIVLRGDAEVLYRRYLHRMKEENRHPVHLTTTLDVKEDFIKTAEWIRKEKVMGETLVVEATDFSYQEDSVVLARVDSFMEGQIVEGV